MRGDPVRPWLAACVLADGADIAATIVDRENLPRHAATGTVALAGAAAVAGAALFVTAGE